MASASESRALWTYLSDHERPWNGDHSAGVVPGKRDIRVTEYMQGKDSEPCYNLKSRLGKRGQLLAFQPRGQV